eukprot:scaffold518_cov388-Prasinococcus_capsulatus_cf.AAC.72
MTSSTVAAVKLSFFTAVEVQAPPAPDTDFGDDSAVGVLAGDFHEYGAWASLSLRVDASLYTS